MREAEVEGAEGMVVAGDGWVAAQGAVGTRCNWLAVWC